jgi:thiol-disulfide isomerase/thioredoxin
MKKILIRNIFSFLICIVLVFGLSGCSKDKPEPAVKNQEAPSKKQDRPPEYNELRAAMRIEDLNTRIKEMEALKVKYPESQYRDTMESSILGAKIDLSTSVDAILDLQKTVLESEEGLNKFYSYYSFSLDILDHEKLQQFDKKKVTKAVIDYVNEGLALSEDTEFLATIPEKQLPRLKRNVAMLHLASARAYLNEGSPEKSNIALKSYLEMEGSKDKVFYYYQALTHEKLGKTNEAFTNYFEAAAENYKDSQEKAKELYNKVNGTLEGFDAKLEAKLRALPFHPAHFSPEPGWAGKAVLVELFTGSECPPCVAADLGFEGLMHSYPIQYVAILVYHLHIPRPDPMTNPAALDRAAYYGTRSTPSTFFDGESKLGGGGGRVNSESKFNQYYEEINSRLYAEPDVQLKIEAVLNGNIVKVTYEADKVLDNVDFNVALVQGEEKYAGSNGIVFHKLVVRDFLNVEAVSSNTVEFDITKAEKAGEDHLADYEKENSIQFKEKHFKIDSSDLRVVFFVQDKESKKVYNAVVADVQE